MDGAMPPLPLPRGPTSAHVLGALRRAPHVLDPFTPPAPDDPLADDDLQLPLSPCCERHSRGFDGVDERGGWEPSLLAFRAQLEGRFERAPEPAVPPLARSKLPPAEDM